MDKELLGFMAAAIKSAVGTDPELQKIVIDTTNSSLKENCTRLGISMGQVSDGYHTFDELYEHRIQLFRLVGVYAKEHEGEFNHFHGEENPTWKSKLNSDGSSIEGWFIAGIFKEKGKQITYHIPMSMWNKFDKWAWPEIDNAPEWDGHTSADVLKRLSEL